MISHHNVISNVLQIATYEKPVRDKRQENYKTEVALGLLPLSHIYGLVVIAQASTWRGDGVIILPKFELESYLNAIQTYKIQTLYLVRSPHTRTSAGFIAKLWQGSADHHSNDQESASLLKVWS